MKILQLLQSNMFSGAENVVCQIVCMMKNEPDIEMIYSSQDGQIREALSERQVPFAPLKELTVSEVRRVINEQKPDIIHAHDMRASFVAALACGKIPLVSHIHNNNFDSRGISKKSIAFLYPAVKAKHVFWVSRSSYEGYFFRTLFMRKSSVLSNIIDIDALYDKMYRDENEYAYDVVYVGRLTYAKNPERLVEVLEKVCKKQGNTKIAIVGTGVLEETVKILSHEKGLDGNIDFLGFCSNPLKIMHDSKVMVMTSRWEGTPMCALEAQSLGVPIVSTPTDGLCEIVTDGKNGFLSEDDDVLAAKIYELISDNEMQARMSGNSKEVMNELMNKQRYIANIMNIYVEMIGDRNGFCNHSHTWWRRRS